MIAELMSFYEKDSPDVDPAFRLSGLLMLLPALEVRTTVVVFFGHHRSEYRVTTGLEYT